MLITWFLMACSEPPPTVASVLVCDPTGSSPSDSCSRDLVAGWARAHLTRTRFTPGAGIQIVTCGADVGSARTHDREVVPATLGTEEQAEAFIAEAVARTSKVDAQPDDRQSPNRSNLLACLSVASRVAGDWDADQVELIIASDGIHIGVGLNFERSWPDAEKVIGKLRGTGLPWDFTGFSSVTLCGFHNVGATSATLANRGPLWTELLTHGRAPEVTIRTTCRGIIDPVQLIPVDGNSR